MTQRDRRRNKGAFKDGLSPRPGATMLAAVYEGPGQVAVKEMPVPAIGAGEALVRMQACGLCGSDALDWYMAPRAPFVFGHGPAGIIAAVGAEVRNFKPGDRVFVHQHAPCNNCSHCQRGGYVHCAAWRQGKLEPGGLAEYFRVPAVNLARHTLLLPANMSFAVATLIEPVACVLKAMERGGIRRDTTVLIIGAGLTGHIFGHLSRWRGARLVLAADTQLRRVGLAQSWAHATFLYPADEQGHQYGHPHRSSSQARLEPVYSGPPLSAGEQLANSVREVNQGEGVDVTVVLPRGPGPLAAAVASTRPGGRIVLFSPPPPDEAIPLPLHDMFFRELTLVPSYSAGPDHTRSALAILTAGGIPAESLIGARVPLQQAAEAYAMLRDPARSDKKIIVTSEL